MSTLTKRGCSKPTWHGPHDWWKSKTGEEHTGEPTLHDYKVELDILRYHCIGKGDDLGDPVGEPESEQMFAAFEQGVKVGRKQMIEQVHQRFVENGYQPHKHLYAILADLMEEADIKP